MSDLRRTAAPVLLCLLAGALIAVSHPADARESGVHARELALARQSLIFGDVEQAIRIYERILESDPDEKRALWGLVEVYSSAGMDREKLVPLLTDWLQEHPDDMRARLELGAAHARLGELERAHEIWTAALRDGKPDAGRYSEVGAMEMRYGMNEQAVETYLEARRVFDVPVLFAEDLVRAYTDLGEYESAIDECVVAVGEHSGIIQWAVNRVEMMLEEGADRRSVERKIDEVASSGSAVPSVLSFAGSAYIALGSPEKAVRAFLLADERAPDQGRQLLEHAMILRSAGLEDEAREAYVTVEERHPGTMNAAMAGVELGIGLAEEGRVEEAIEALEETAGRYTQFSAGGEALLAVARLKLRELGEPTEAIATIDRLLSEERSRGKRLDEEASLLRLHALMGLSRFDEAHGKAEELLSGRLHDDVHEKVAYARAFSSFLAHERMRALDEFREMIEEDPAGSLV
ncbi:MAG: tetratricopeptide repeat protein, partial [Candidatus Eisenbacteria bacterium]|nr:tetratricopeptide repeat protein [Candidatus Eisenbacteria bacterium]